MGQVYRQFAKYQPVIEEQLYNTEMVDSVGEAAQLVNNALALFAQCGRNQGAVLANYPTDSNERDIVLTIEANKKKTVFALMPEGMISGAGQKVKFWYYSSADAETACIAHAEVGRHSGGLDYTESTDFGWHSIEVDCDVVEPVNLLEPRVVRLWFEAGGTDIEIYLRSLAVFEKGKVGAPTYLDLSSALIGEEDYPYDAVLCKLLNDNIRACYAHRMPRTILAQCMINRVKYLSADYDADHRGLACFMVNKSQGQTSIDGRLLIGRDAGTATFYIGAWSTAGVEIASDTIDKADANAWEDFNLAGLDSDETEYEIRIDAKEHTSATEAYLFNTFACVELSGSDSVELPTKTRVQVDDDVLCQDWARVNDLLTQVWTRQRQILINQEHWTTSKRSGSDYPILDSGMLHATYGARYLHCQAWVSLPTREGTGKLDFDGQTINLTEDNYLTQGTDARALIEHIVDNGATGSLYLREVTGDFSDNQAITDGAGDGNVNGRLDNQPDDVKVFIKLSIQLDNSAPVYTETEIYTDERELSGKWGQAFRVDLRVPIPSEYWNDYDDHSGWPIVYKLKAKTEIQDSETNYGSFDWVVLRHALYREEVEVVLSEVGL